MSNSETRLHEALERFRLLRSIHSVFALSIPTPRDGESGRYGAMSEASLADLVDDITLLRSDVISLPIRLQQIDIKKVQSEADIDQLIRAFDSMLGLFEDSVLDLDEVADARPPQDTGCVASFPKLATLQNLLRQLDDEAVSTDARDVDGSESSTNAHEQSTTPGSTGLADQQNLSGLSKVTSYISFPPPRMTIATCRTMFEDFGKLIGDGFRNAERQLNAESLLEEVTDAEVESIRQAGTFSEAASSLFSLLVDCITCEAGHIARLHLSGFHTRQLEMLLGTGENDLIPTCFIPSTTLASSERRLAHRMCAHMTAAEYHGRTIRSCFNESTVWEDCVLEHALYDLATDCMPTSTLDNCLQGLNPQSKCRPNARTRSLDRIGRQIVGVLLACSLFHLCGSPWLQRGFARENILLLPSKTPGSQLDYWRPHISCDLSYRPGPRSLPEDVAALGILILELETQYSAGWTDDDEDYDTATKSNRARLFRILGEWKGDLPDSYRDIGTACFLFEQLVEGFDHPRVGESSRGLAVLYKCIVNPLFQRLVIDFSEAERLFQGISGLAVPRGQKRASTTGRLVLYDDWESSRPDEESKWAGEWIGTLEDGFLRNIRTLRQNSAQIGLAETLMGVRTPGKIRIAVLDTGIDPTDRIIKSAMSRIVDKRSWVGPPDNYVDTYGHGTHVTRLLLKMAPSAEIYVAKITDNKYVVPENMFRIAEAIDWAVERWNAHIISMSFGFDDQNKAIDDAIAKAFKADKLMFAAASNEGGNKGRSRPGRNPNVICIHACDGKGNKGKMSPNPVKKKDNFSTLGVAVHSRWNKQTVYKSGTSFATAVAAGIAANILEFANFKCKLLEEHRQVLYKRDGMLEVFRAMSTERDGYDYVQPGRLWNGKDEDNKKLATLIQDVLLEL